MYQGKGVRQRVMWIMLFGREILGKSVRKGICKRECKEENMEERVLGRE